MKYILSFIGLMISAHSSFAEISKNFDKPLGCRVDIKIALSDIPEEGMKAGGGLAYIYQGTGLIRYINAPTDCVGKVKETCASLIQSAVCSRCELIVE